MKEKGFLSLRSDGSVSSDVLPGINQIGTEGMVTRLFHFDILLCTGKDGRYST